MTYFSKFKFRSKFDCLLSFSFILFSSNIIITEPTIPQIIPNTYRLWNFSFNKKTENVIINIGIIKKVSDEKCR